MKIQELYETIDGIGPEITAMADMIFDYKELPFEEVRSCELLCQWLEKEGFAVERGAGGVPTAFRAVYERGTGGLCVGLICEYDALPNGHSCGHHMQGPAILAAAKALKESSCEKPFKLVIYGTPAEENLLGKPRMIAGGCFRDIDVALQVHAHSNTYVSDRSMTGVDLHTVFTGVHAHDTACPWNNRSGCDAMMQAIQGIEYLRGHVHDGTRFFYRVRDGIGIAGNTDPSRAEIIFSFRTYDMADVPDLEQRVRDIIHGAALMCGVKADIEKTLEVQGIMPNHTIRDIMLKYAAEVGARQILQVPKAKGGSNDFGNVTQLMPGAEFFICMAPDGMAMHTDAIREEFMSDFGKKGAVTSAKVTAATAMTLICDDEKMTQAKAEFDQRHQELQKQIDAIRAQAHAS